jgi:hypothetical protein
VRQVTVETFRVPPPGIATGEVRRQLVHGPHGPVPLGMRLYNTRLHSGILGAVEVRDVAQYGDGSSTVAKVRWSAVCGERLDCGSVCVLAWWHVGPCECGGDRPGQPGTCGA